MIKKAKPVLTLAYLDSALDSLEKIPAKFRDQIIKRINTLPGNPFPPGAEKVQNQSHSGHRVDRIRSGDYRILYSTQPPQIIILDIGDRKDVYRNL